MAQSGPRKGRKSRAAGRGAGPEKQAPDCGDADDEVNIGLSDIGATLGDIVPGKDLEKAAANVATDAGKTLIRGLRNTLGVLTAEWAAKKQAKADAARLAIATVARIDEARALSEARREDELAEIEHEAKLVLAKRRADRMIHEMAREQQNLETIAARSLEIIEGDPDAKPSQIDDDWLFQFAAYAQRISDRQIQELWSRILASAAVANNRTRLSAPSLLLLSLIDRRTAEDFSRFCKIIQSIGAFLVTERQFNVQKSEFQYLEEMGLVQRIRGLFVPFHTFDLVVHDKVNATRMEYLQLSARGAEIRAAISIPTARSSADLNIVGENVKSFKENVKFFNMGDDYLRMFLTEMAGKSAIIPKRGGERLSFQYIVGAAQSRWASFSATPDEVKLVDKRLLEIIGWVGMHYPVNIEVIDQSAPE